MSVLHSGQVCIGVFCRDGLVLELENGKPRLVLAKYGMNTILITSLSLNVI